MSLWLLLLVMALATYRLTRFLVEDTFPPVLWIRDRLAGGWRPLTEGEREQRVRDARAWHDAEKPLPARWPTRDIGGVEHRWVKRWGWSPQWLADLISCPWCASGWVAAGVTASTWAAVGLPVPVLVWLAVWAAGALIAGQEWA